MPFDTRKPMDLMSTRTYRLLVTLDRARPSNLRRKRELPGACQFFLASIYSFVRWPCGNARAGNLKKSISCVGPLQNGVYGA